MNTTGLTLKQKINTNKESKRGYADSYQKRNNTRLKYRKKDIILINAKIY